jgi:uncharacterized protein YutE (UPF0331/DUF86 family)
MTDADLVAKKLAAIETAVVELRTLAKPGDLERDVREARFVERTLQIAIQALLDTASHIVSDERLGEPATNRQLVALLARGGWLPDEQVPRLSRMIAFRNVLVHNYDTVDLSIVRDVLEHHLDDLLAFTAAIRDRMQRPTESA